MAGPGSVQERWVLEVPHVRAVAWRNVGLAAAAGAALRELGLLLGAIESSGGQSYSMSVLTGPALDFWNAGPDIEKALTVWQADAVRSAWWVACYLLIEVVLFAPAVSRVLYLLMGAVGLPRLRARSYALLVFLAIAARAVVTAAVLCTGSDLYWVIRLSSTAAWGMALFTVLVVVASWGADRVDGPASKARAVRISRRGLQGGAVSPAVGVRWLLLIVVLFVAFIALPAGGPLEQLPDVLRAQLSPPLGIVPAAGTVAVLALALVIGGWRATPPDGRLRPAPSTPGLLVALGIPGGSLALLAGLSGSPNWAAALAVPAALAALAGANRLRERALRTANTRVDRGLDELVRFWAAATSGIAERRARLGTVLHLGRTGPAPQPRRPAAPATPTAAAPPPPGPADDAERVAELRRLWLGGLAGAVVAGTGIGLIRATFRPAVVLPHAWWWSFGAVAGLLLAVYGAVATQYVISWILTRRRLPGRLLTAVGFVVVAGGCLTLAVRPATAEWLGSSGTFALCLALVALLVGELQHLSRTREAWAVTRELGLGRRSPWLGVLVVTWVLTTLFSSGGYHEVRVVSATPALAPTYRDLDDAWQRWRQAVLTTPGCADTGRPVPLMIVAAPGGGIRASYWTAAVLDRLVTRDRCGRAKIFAVSAVSGGALGTAAWVQAPDGRARDRVGALAQDSTLAATTAALFLRDLPRPLTGFTRPWSDRAAVMEDSWAARAPDLFSPPDAPRTWSQLRSPRGWTPAVVLNGSSVTDGCRILVSNVGRLPTASPDCRSAVPADLGGPVSGGLDATDGLAGGLGVDGASCAPAGGHGDLRILSAALLSARFPVISPSGILKRCLPGPGSSGTVVTTVDVDGGYFDNSGLLSALAIWNAVQGEIGNCRHDCLTIEPTIVVADNHYRSTVVRPPESDRSELMIPAQALAAALETASPERLEQVARVAMKAYTTSTTQPAHVLRISPQNGPGISAPLGWVLSPATQADLNRQLDNASDRPTDP